MVSKIIHFKHPADIEKPSPQAIFITSGTPSNALPLTPISDVSGPISVRRTLIITDRIAGKNSSVIFRGNVDKRESVVCSKCLIVDKLSVYTVTNEFGGDTNKEAIIAESSARQAEGNSSTVAINSNCGELE